MKRGLINAQFIFKPKGPFFLKLPVNAPTEFRELESMNQQNVAHKIQRADRFCRVSRRGPDDDQRKNHKWILLFF